MSWIMSAMSVLFLGLCLAGVWLQRRRRWQAAALSLSANLADSELLRELIACVQQHRGLACSELAGDRSFQARREQMAAAVDALLKQLRPLAQREETLQPACLTRNELDLFRFHWQVLRDGLAALSPEQCLASHSDLLMRPLAWLETLGKWRLEPLFAAVGDQERVRNFAVRLPALSECLGQIRAIGSSVVVQGRCSPVARVRLVFLASRVESMLAVAEQVELGAGPTWFEPARRGAVRQAVEILTEVVRGELLTGLIRTTPEAYFALATQAIDQVFSWMNAYTRALLRHGEHQPADEAAPGDE